MILLFHKYSKAKRGLLFALGAIRRKVSSVRLGFQNRLIECHSKSVQFLKSEVIVYESVSHESRYESVSGFRLMVGLGLGLGLGLPFFPSG